jgi:uncharacterized protein (DUF924 family)
MTAAEVLEFWFGTPAGAVRREWFVKDPVFDETIRARFGEGVDRALQGPLGWGPSPAERLAEIVVLDQFPRNLFRGQARAFAGDARACALALALIDEGADRELLPVQRWFAYLPLEHAEDLALQQRSVALFKALAAEDSAMEGAADYARRHRDVIARFGRFPHRNAALGRESTDAERAYLAQPGSGF